MPHSLSPDCYLRYRSPEDASAPSRAAANRLPATPAPRSIERRNLASRRALLQRVLDEYAEQPALRLTVAQARRLFGLREDICVRVLETLVRDAVLERSRTGTYCRSAKLTGRNRA